jgi:hypothetical protein
MNFPDNYVFNIHSLPSNNSLWIDIFIIININTNIYSFKHCTPHWQLTTNHIGNMFDKINENSNSNSSNDYFQQPDSFPWLLWPLPGRSWTSQDMLWSNLVKQLPREDLVGAFPFPENRKTILPFNFGKVWYFKWKLLLSLCRAVPTATFIPP